MPRTKGKLSRTWKNVYASVGTEAHTTGEDGFCMGLSKFVFHSDVNAEHIHNIILDK